MTHRASQFFLVNWSNNDHCSDSCLGWEAETMANAHLKLVAPTTVKRTVTPKRPPNRDIRTREYLTEAEFEKLMNAAKGNIVQ
jgi:hypothetical protein